MDDRSEDYNFQGIMARFKVEGDLLDIKPFGTGHINDTFLVKTTGNVPGYLLQKINGYVFKDIDGLMNNMVTVTDHLKKKIAKTGDPTREVLTLIACNNGKYYFTDENEHSWRMTLFLKDTKSYDVVSTNQQAYQGGFAFGRFLWLLCDLRPDLLIDTIPDFLNIQKRLGDLIIAIGKNTVQRLATVSPELDFLVARATRMKEILEMGKTGELPLRITHNDTKFNNILLNKDNNIQCVIDLDTVMPGFVAYDFGDAVRSIINTAAEDEKNLDTIRLDISLYAEFAKGFLRQTYTFLTEAEVCSLIKGVMLLPYMQAVRFLTDYLDGDVYYKTNFEEHNLQRTRAQIQLLKTLELHEEELAAIIRSEWEELRCSPNVERLT